MDDLRYSYLSSRKRLTDPKVPQPNPEEAWDYIDRKTEISSGRSNIDYALAFINSHIRVARRKKSFPKNKGKD